MAKREVYLIEGARTAFGEFGGSFKDVTAIDLAAACARKAMEKSNVSPEEIDQVVIGNVIQSSPDAVYTGRHVGLKSGVPKHVPGLTVNRLCGSGLQAIISAAQSILLGEADLALAGGAENMSQVPHVIRGARWGIPLGKLPWRIICGRRFTILMEIARWRPLQKTWPLNTGLPESKRTLTPSGVSSER